MLDYLAVPLRRKSGRLSCDIECGLREDSGCHSAESFGCHARPLCLASSPRLSVQRECRVTGCVCTRSVLAVRGEVSSSGIQAGVAGITVAGCFGRSFPPMVLKSAETFDPSEAAAVGTTMTMPAAITPCSIAVTPLRPAFTRPGRANVYAILHFSAPKLPDFKGATSVVTSDARPSDIVIRHRAVPSRAISPKATR